MGLRIGIGRDFHRFKVGSGFHLGGVLIPANYAVEAHSDGDCLVHALIDALLGAMALPNIGALFPQNAANRDRSSCEMLGEVVSLVHGNGFRLENVDATVSLERPRLTEFFEMIRGKLAPILGVDQHLIGLKATTGEGCGPVGRSEGVEVLCVCLLHEAQEKGEVVDGRSV